MPGDYKRTHEKILTSAKHNFLITGYERTNLRKICKDAGITTGAFYRHFQDKESLFATLVEPAIQEIKNIYLASEIEFYDLLYRNEMSQVSQVSYKAGADFINYIYDNFDCFKLLLTNSNGTKYENFIDGMVTLGVSEAEKLFSILKQKKIEFNKLRKKEYHLLTHSYFSSFFEVVTHDFTREEALQFGHTLMTFSNAGWWAILGIK